MLKGSLVALVTPFNMDGTVNFFKLGWLIEFHIKNNTAGIVILGTTGESATLTFEEEEDIVRFCVEKVGKRIPLIVGSGSNCTKTALTYSKKYEQMGADMLLVITPYYNKTNSLGMIEHFKVIADSVNIPIIMYNVPSRTGCSIDIEAIEVLSKHRNIVGIKEASGNLSYAVKISKYLSDDFVMYSGNDDIIVPMLSIGSVGVISVFANICPRVCADIVNNYLDGNCQEAVNLQVKYLNLINALFYETNPIPIKEAMNYLGFEVGNVRLPLYHMGESAKERLIKVLDRYQGEII